MKAIPNLILNALFSPLLTAPLSVSIGWEEEYKTSTPLPFEKIQPYTNPENMDALLPLEL